MPTLQISKRARHPKVNRRRPNPEANDRPVVRTREIVEKEIAAKTAKTVVEKIAAKASSAGQEANVVVIHAATREGVSEANAEINPRGISLREISLRTIRVRVASQVHSHKVEVSNRVIQAEAINHAIRVKTGTILAPRATTKTEGAVRVLKEVSGAMNAMNAVNEVTASVTTRNGEMLNVAIPIVVTQTEVIHPGEIPTKAIQTEEVIAIQNRIISNENIFCIVPVGRSVMGVQRQSRI